MQPTTPATETGASPDIRLLEAAKNGNLDLTLINTLIAEKVDLTVRDKEGFTALHLAAENGHVEAVKVLVKAVGDESIDIQNSKDRYNTPLHCASLMGHAEVVTALLELGANPMIADESGRNALHHAAEHGNTEVVRALLKKMGKNGINICNPIDGCTALLYATDQSQQYNKHSIVEDLIKLKANVNATDKRNNTPLYNSAFDGDAKSVKILIENGADIEGNHAQDESPLRIATEWGRVKVIEVLLKNGAFVSEVVKWGEHAGESVIDSYEDLTDDEIIEEMCKIFFKYGAKISPEFLQRIRDNYNIPEATKNLLESYATTTEIEARDKGLLKDEDLIKAHKKLILNGKLTLDSANTLILYNEIFGDVIAKAINSLTKEELKEIEDNDPKEFKKIQQSGLGKLGLGESGASPVTERRGTPKAESIEKVKEWLNSLQNLTPSTTPKTHSEALLNESESRPGKKAKISEAGGKSGR